MSAGQPTVLVTGASGALGPAVVNLLGTRGYRIRVLGLVPPTQSLYAIDVDSFTGDICDRALLDTALDGASSVIHMAALLHINNPSSQMRTEYERVNVSGTQAIVDAALRNEVKRLVFLSTIAVYGFDRRIILTEQSEPMPGTIYAQTKLAGEQIVLHGRRTDGVQLGATLRLGAVYGSRVKGNYSRLVDAIARGRFVPVGSGDNRRTVVHEKDVAAAIALALESPKAAGQIYNVTDGEVHPLREIIMAICTALGRPPPKIVLPAAPIRAVAELADRVAELVGRPLPVNSGMLDKYLEDVAVDGGRIMRELDYRPNYGLQAGWQEAIAGIRAAGALAS